MELELQAYAAIHAELTGITEEILEAALEGKMN